MAAENVILHSGKLKTAQAETLWAENISTFRIIRLIVGCNKQHILLHYIYSKGKASYNDIINAKLKSESYNFKLG